MWSAGHHALRALTEAAAEELRPEGIRVALLRIDGPIRSPKSEPRLKAENVPDDAVLDQGQIAAALAALVAQGDEAFTYELGLTATGRPAMA
jgi:short-subunit dehydrogenase